MTTITLYFPEALIYIFVGWVGYVMLRALIAILPIDT